MTFSKLKGNWIKLVETLNRKGIPIPFLRDPATGLSSVSLTLVFISFNVWLVSMIGKVSGALGGVNTNDVFNMVLACFGLYFGRKFQSDGKGKVELSELSKENKDGKPEEKAGS